MGLSEMKSSVNRARPPPEVLEEHPPLAIAGLQGRECLGCGLLLHLPVWQTSLLSLAQLLLTLLPPSYRDPCDHTGSN